MQIRRAVVNDAENIKQLVSSLSHFYLEDDGALIPGWFLDSLAISEFERRLSTDVFDNFVCIVGDEIAGYISLKLKNHLYHLFVAEKHQGKGLSRALWEYAIAGSVESIFTVRSSLFAVPVYRRFGFRESEAVASRGGIAFQPMVLMRKNQVSAIRKVWNLLCNDVWKNFKRKR